MEILVADGPAGLTIAALCASLGTTNGSFYHHFRNLHGYTKAVGQRWETRHGNEARALSRSEGTPNTRLLRHHAAMLALDHDIDAVVRSWAATNPIVTAAQQRVDELWHAALFALLHDLVGNAGTARRLAVLGRSVVIGYQMIATVRHAGELDALLIDFEDLVRDYCPTGKAHAEESPHELCPWAPRSAGS